MEKCVINSEGNEISEASKMSNLTGAKTGTNLPNQLEVVLCQDSNGRLDGLASTVNCDYTCHSDGQSEVVSQLCTRDADGVSGLNTGPAATTVRELLLVHFVYFTDFESVHLMISHCNFVINFRKMLIAKVRTCTIFSIILMRRRMTVTGNHQKSKWKF